MPDRWESTSASPVSPRSGRGELTADDLFAEDGAVEEPLDERLRRTYFWLVNRALISPYYDVEFSDGPPVGFDLGDAGARLTLPTAQSYSSNVLLPLLAFAVGGRCLLVGGPGRGKTTLAVVLGVLAGDDPADVRRHVQQGQPQLTVADLVGAPLPGGLMAAERAEDVRIAWRGWLTRPVKVVDEFNRIPTRTQSALLTMVAEGYVEQYDQLLRTAPDGVESWFFTANDDAGGGTFPVIQALLDRMDVTVLAAGFNHRFFDELVARVEAGERPEDHVPAELRVTPAERRATVAAIRAVPIPVEVRRRLEFFCGHFEFVQGGARRFENRTKDALTTAGGDVSATIDANSGADQQADLGAQTLGSPSVRALQTLILYAKAMAWFRGAPAVEVQDVAAVLPFVLRGKLRPNPAHPRFEEGADRELAHDPQGWLADLFAQSNREYDALGLATEDPVGDLLAELDRGLDGLGRVEVGRRVTAVQTRIREIAATGKLYGRDFDDLIALKYAHQRYTNYLRWLDGG